MLLRFGCVVEGHGEKTALKVLLNRLVREIDPGLAVDAEPWRSSKGSLVASHGIEKVVETVVRITADIGAVFVLMDSDKDCPATLGPSLYKRIAGVREHLPVSVVVAQCEYEAWFLASAVSLAEAGLLNPGTKPPPDPESIRGAKEWLSKRSPSRIYTATRHQAAFTRALDFSLARQTRSFRKLEADVRRLVENYDSKSSRANV